MEEYLTDGFIDVWKPAGDLRRNGKAGVCPSVSRKGLDRATQQAAAVAGPHHMADWKSTVVDSVIPAYENDNVSR